MFINSISEDVKNRNYCEKKIRKKSLHVKEEFSESHLSWNNLNDNVVWKFSTFVKLTNKEKFDASKEGS